jgi:toxin ParE1/3/4
VSRYVLSPRARRDLEEIWGYSVARWSTPHAERYIRELVLGIEIIAADPRGEQPCDDIRAGYRKYVIASHIVFYRMTDDTVDVVRIMHGRMDFNRICDRKDCSSPPTPLM